MGELTQAAFESTFVRPMRNVSDSANELVDLWSYADEILASEYPDSDWSWRVKHIYESGDGRYQHLLVPVPVTNAYLAFVVDVSTRSILGHHLLDLGTLYGTTAYPTR
jgi:hypothetical protein